MRSCTENSCKLMTTGNFVKKSWGNLVQCGAINDKRYAQKLAEYLIECKHYGIFRVRQEMLRKGLDKHLVEDTLSDLEDCANDYIFRSPHQKIWQNFS